MTLEIDEDPSFQRKEWIAQRFGIGLMALLVLAAVLGFTGRGGPFSHGEVDDPSRTLRVEYERFVRRGAPNTVTLHLRSVKPGSRSFWLSAEYLRKVDVESVEPDPEVSVAEGDRYVYTIRTNGSEATVTVRTRSTSAGWIDVDVGMVDGPSVHFRQTSLF